MYLCVEPHTYAISDADVERKCMHSTCTRHRWPRSKTLFIIARLCLIYRKKLSYVSLFSVHNSTGFIYESMKTPTYVEKSRCKFTYGIHSHNMNTTLFTGKPTLCTMVGDDTICGKLCYICLWLSKVQQSTCMNIYTNPHT